jgi:hypothetical protein
MSKCGFFGAWREWPEGSKGPLDRLLDQAIARERPQTPDQWVHLKARVWFRWLEERRLQSHERGQGQMFTQALFNQWWVLDQLLPFEEVLAIQREVDHNIHKS